MKAIITAAGHGTRMLPITKSVPKELLPVGSKPVIQYIVEGLTDSGVQDIVVVTSQGKQAIEDYFDKNYELEETLRQKNKENFLEEINKPKNLANYSFVKQKQQLGFPHAILEASPWINDDYFVLTVGDEIYHPNIYKNVIDKHRQTGSPVIAVKEVEPENIDKYGIVKIDNDIITDMVEKPSYENAPSNLRMIGVYVLPKSIFNIIKNTPLDAEKGEIQLPDCLKNLMHEETIYPYIAEDKVWDVGSPESWLKANMEIFNEDIFN